MKKTPHPTQTPERRGNDGRMESMENQKTVFHPSHRPWKSLLRFPHSHRAYGFPLSLKTKPERSSPLPVRLTSVQAHPSMRICFRPRWASLIHDQLERRKRASLTIGASGARRNPVNAGRDARRGKGSLPTAVFEVRAAKSSRYVRPGF